MLALRWQSREKRLLSTLEVLAILGVLFLTPTRVWSDEFRPLYRGARAQAMGNAFVAVADDEQAIFYNPAGLAGVQYYSVQFAGINADLSNELVTSSSTLTEVLNNPGLSQIGQIIGKNYYMRAQATASILAPGFGIAGIYDYQGAIRLENPTLPQGMLGAQNTYGAQVAFGKRLFRFKKNQAEFRFGMAAKVLVRGGGYQSPSLTQLLTLSSSTLSASLNSQGIGYGVDSGVQVVYPLTRRRDVNLNGAIAMTDIGDTSFTGGAEAQKANLKAGVALTYQRAQMKTTLAFDYARILDYADWRKKVHFGGELRFPLFSFYAGMNQLQATFGAGLDLGLFKFMYASYAEELGAGSGQDSERRHLLHFSFKFDI